MAPYRHLVGHEHSRHSRSSSEHFAPEGQWKSEEDSPRRVEHSEKDSDGGGGSSCPGTMTGKRRKRRKSGAILVLVTS